MADDSSTRGHAMRALASPVLLIGASGMLGRVWRRLLTSAGVSHTAPDENALNVLDPDAPAEWVNRGFRTVINAAAWTDVDGAETHEAEAMALNAEAPARLAAACIKTSALLVHYSTDYVFSGVGDRPWREDDPTAPASAYGRTKAAGEAAVANSGASCLIVRTSWLYAPWGRNFVLTMLDLMSRNAELKVVDDQRGRPTSAMHLAKTTCELIAAGARGVVHVCDGGECTWCGFAQEIARQASLPARVVPCSTAEYPRPAPRPAYSVLDLERAERVVGPMPSWPHNLAEVLANIPHTEARA